MELQTAMLHRQSCRSYSSQPVEREKLTACLEAGRLAPSSCNSQCWLFLAVDDPARCSKLADALRDDDLGINQYAEEIPAYIVITQHPPRRSTAMQEKIMSAVDYSQLDLGFAAMQICLAATDQGLGSVIMGWFATHKVRWALDIPDTVEVPLIIGLGYPKDSQIRRKSRFPFDEVVRWNSYSQSDA